MLGDKLNTYRPTIDPEYSEDGQELGINLISNVKNPAVKIRGVAFSNHEARELRFKDDLKLRIAAPVLVPSHIYRSEEDENYYMEFTVEDIEIIAKDFMSKLTTKTDGVFNLEHENQMVDSYIFEAILVDSETKVKMIKSDYGIDVPVGTFFIVQQFTDKNVYDDIIKRDAIGFSFEGFMGTKLVKEYKFKNDKIMKNLKLSKMKSPKKIVGSKRIFKSASKKMKFEEVIEGEVILVADEFKEGSDIVVIEDVVAGAVEDFTGEIDAVVDGKEEVLIIEDGVITEVVEGEAVADTEKEEAVIASEGEVEVKEEEMEEEVKEEEMEEEVKEEEMEEVAPVDAPEAGNELDEIYKILADIKAELAELKAGVPVEDEVIDEVLLREQKFSNALASFNKFAKSRS